MQKSMNRLIAWLRESNRWKHLLGGLAVGVATGGAWAALAAGGLWHRRWSIRTVHTAVLGIGSTGR